MLATSFLVAVLGSVSVDIWVEPAAVNVNRTSARSAHALELVDIALQRGEQETRSIVVRSTAATTVLITPPTIARITTRVEQQGFVDCKPSIYYSPSGGGYLPDPLLPSSADADNAFAFPLEANVSQAFLVTFHAARDAEPGKHEGDLTVAIGTMPARNIPFKLLLWNLTLPRLADSGALSTIATFAQSDMSRFFPWTNTTRKEAYSRLCSARFAPDDLYHAALRDPAELELLATGDTCDGGAKHLNLLDVTNLPGGGRKDNFSSAYVASVLVAIEAGLASVPEQLHHTLYVYGFDEFKPEAREGVYQIYGAVKRRWPWLTTVATLNWPTMPADLPVDVWVDEYPHYNASKAAAWLSHPPAGGSGCEGGCPRREYFLYHCIGPAGADWLNTFVERPFIQARLLMGWLTTAYVESSGYLYYEMSRWSALTSLDRAPLRRLNASTSLTDFNPATFNSANGDGSWTYPGEAGLLSSTRLVAIRDGVEDWQLLRRLPSAARASIVRHLVRNGTDWTADATLLEKTRRKAAALALQASST